MYKRCVVRRIEEFNFGHPAMNRTFKQHTHTFGSAHPVLKDSGVKKSTLPNGVRLTTHDKDTIHTSVGVYIEAGAKYDPIGAPGLSYAMRWALLTSNLENSLFQLDRMFRARGASYTHNEVRKRHIAIRLESRRDMWKEPFEYLCTSIAAPRFAESDIERFRDTWDNLIEEKRWQYPREYVVDQLERVAFYKEPLGNPRQILRGHNDESSSERMIAQYVAQFVPTNITIAGVNVEHSDITAAYLSGGYPHSAEAPHFRDGKRLSLSHTREEAQYQPGRQEHEQEKRAAAMGTKPYMEDETIAAIGWPANGRDESAAAFAASSVTQQVLSILHKDGINYRRENTSDGIRTFYRPFSSSGLLGFTVRGTVEGTPKQVREVAKSIPNETDAATLEAAKQRALLDFYSEELETTRDYVDFLATSTQSEQEIIDAIKAVDVAAVNKQLQAMRSTKPVLFATGEVKDFPSIKQLGF